jgi:NAD-dependent SIR2 family protein deacetylase
MTDRIETVYCTSCGKHVPVTTARQTRVKPARYQCARCDEALRRNTTGADDVVGEYPDGKPLLRKHKTASGKRSSQRAYQRGKTFPGVFS